MKKKTAFIIGVTGQDGSYLSELLIKKKVQSFWLHKVYKKKKFEKFKNSRNS